MTNLCACNGQPFGSYLAHLEDCPFRARFRPLHELIDLTDEGLALNLNPHTSEDTNKVYDEKEFRDLPPGKYSVDGNLSAKGRKIWQLGEDGNGKTLLGYLAADVNIWTGFRNVIGPAGATIDMTQPYVRRINVEGEEAYREPEAAPEDPFTVAQQRVNSIAAQMERGLRESDERKKELEAEYDRGFEHGEQSVAPTSRRGEVLIESLKTITQDRQDQYGQPEDSFGTIAEFWSTYLTARRGQVVIQQGEYELREVVAVAISPKDVAMLMSLLKAAREAHGPKLDNLVDQAGYSAIAAELAELEKKD